jgi:hypothetical protein
VIHAIFIAGIVATPLVLFVLLVILPPVIINRRRAKAGDKEPR